jgi:hypothetical protein
MVGLGDGFLTASSLYRPAESSLNAPRNCGIQVQLDPPAQPSPLYDQESQVIPDSVLTGLVFVQFGLMAAVVVLMLVFFVREVRKYVRFSLSSRFLEIEPSLMAEIRQASNRAIAQAIRDLLKSGRRSDAIEIYRRMMSVSPQEAMDAVAAIEDESSDTANSNPTVADVIR